MKQLMYDEPPFNSFSWQEIKNLGNFDLEVDKTDCFRPLKCKIDKFIEIPSFWRCQIIVRLEVSKMSEN